MNVIARRSRRDRRGNPYKFPLIASFHSALLPTGEKRTVVQEFSRSSRLDVDAILPLGSPHPLWDRGMSGV